jgi:hypothetical protein
LGKPMDFSHGLFPATFEAGRSVPWNLAQSASLDPKMLRPVEGCLNIRHVATDFLGRKLCGEHGEWWWSIMRNQMKPPDCTYNYWLVVWNHGILWLSIYRRCHHPNGPSPSFFREVGWNMLKPPTRSLLWQKSLWVTINHY